MKFYKKIEKPLGQLLIERGIISNSQIQEALEVQKKEGGLIGEVIVKLGFAKEEEIAQCISLQYGFPFLSLNNYEISPDVIKLVPKHIASYYCLIPIDKIQNILTVAMANPLNYEAIEDLEYSTSLNVQVFISTPSEIRKAIEKFYK